MTTDNAVTGLFEPLNSRHDAKFFNQYGFVVYGIFSIGLQTWLGS